MNEIVKNLRKCRSARNALVESLKNKNLLEADEETEEEELDTPEEGVPAEDDTAPASGPIRSTPDEDSPEEEDFVDPDGDTEEENQKEVEDDEEDTTEYVNPLDNPYAVKHTLGDEVLLAYANGTNSKLKGQIDGYDKEGFYRILWSNGMTTNGITDLALADLVRVHKESKCVCGHTEFVTEGKYVVCDTCGRRIREATDILTPIPKEDKKGKKGKIIRAEMHPVTTAIKPNISETIKNAFKKKPITDSLDLEDEEDENVSLKKKGIPYIFQRLYKSLNNQFWTRLPELVEDIEELGYEVIFSNSEVVVVGPGSSAHPEDEDFQYLIPLAGTARTITLNFDRARLD